MSSKAPSKTIQDVINDFDCDEITATVFVLKKMGLYNILDTAAEQLKLFVELMEKQKKLEAQVKRMNEDSLNCVHIPYDKEDLLDKIRYYHGHNRVEIDENGKIIYPLKHIEGIDWYRELVNEAVERMSGETHLSWSDAVEDAIGDNTYHDEKNDWVCWGEKPDEE